MVGTWVVPVHEAALDNLPEGRNVYYLQGFVHTQKTIS